MHKTVENVQTLFAFVVKYHRCTLIRNVVRLYCYAVHNMQPVAQLLQMLVTTVSSTKAEKLIKI